LGSSVFYSGRPAWQ